MDLLSFLEKIINKTGSSSLPPVFCFVGKKYPALFFQHLHKLYKNNNHVLQFLDAQSLLEDASARSMLEMSFLGSKMLYVLQDFSVFDPKKQNTLLQYLTGYKGPHTIQFFSEQPIMVKIPTVVLPHDIDQQLFVTLFTMFFPEQQQKTKSSVIQAFFKKYTFCSLENACLLMNYVLVLGAKSEHAVEELFEHLFVPEKSLFVLSTYFFARQEKEFFGWWQLIKHDYSDVFWTTFWSEQLFRAHAYKELMQQKDIFQAKKCAFRLPFSFVQREWKQVTFEQLKKAHDTITTIDWHIKNGIAPHFEQFFLGFFKV